MPKRRVRQHQSWDTSQCPVALNVTPAPGRLTKWLKTIGGILSIVAVLVSVTTYVKGESRRRKDVTFEIIQKTYEKYSEMNRIELEKPYLTHLFVVSDRYLRIKQNIREVTGVISNQQRAKYLLEERAVADFIFTYYEQTLFQWSATKDKERRFSHDLLAYFRSTLLRNPRLIYWWRIENGGLEVNYALKTRKDWETHVLEWVDTTKPAECDAVGPFGDAVITPTTC